MMLKYCEQYKNMRESLCREHTVTDYCRVSSEAVLPHSKRSLQIGEITNLSCDEFPAQRETKAKCGVVKSKSDEGRHHRRSSVNFEKEFTFTPRLNLASVRMAKERTARVRKSIEKRANALVAEVQMNFTFKPKVSSRSEKIAQGLKTSFLERQLIHVEKQKKILNVNQEIIPVSHTKQGRRLIPMIRSHKQKKSTKNQELRKSGRLIQTDCKTDEIQSIELTRSNPGYLLEAGDTVHDKVAPSYNSVNRNPTTEGCTQNVPYHFENRTNLPSKRHKRLKTHAERQDDRDDLLAEDSVIKSAKLVLKSKDADRRKTSTVVGKVTRGAQQHNLQLFNKLRETKKTAEAAMKSHKVFVCHGPYPIVRASLRKRGWVEKEFKACPAVVTNSNETSNPNSSDNEDDDVVEKGDRTCTSGKMDDEGIDNTEWSAGYEGEDCEYSLLSRFCRNATATFFWTCKRDDVDFKYLRKDQIANHFSKAYSFTTKVGLCMNLRNLAWFEDANSDEFFPRCHRLGSDEEKGAFIDDYRLTSACNILKLLTKRANSQSTTNILKTKTSKPKSSISLRETMRSRNQQRSPSCSPKSQRSRSSLGSGNNRRSVIAQNPSHAIILALRACRQFIMCRNNEDIDGQYENAMLTEEDWENLIGFYYHIMHKGSRIEGGEEYIERCEEMLQEMRNLLPQLDLDGFRNVWIVKPGAKSRGRGIMCMDRLEDILKLVSSTVKKENRWIIQKYIETPLLVYNTKFDIRQWFLVTDWNPLTLWFYKECYFRFCSQEFTLDNFEPCIHLANNSIQKHYQNGVRDERLPDNNMWSSDDFRNYLREKGQSKLWEEVIYPGMRQAIVYTLECCQLSLEARKNSFELYGADFMLTEDYKPWLIEINSSPAMGASTAVTRKLCANVIEDTMKVVLDRREDKNCDTGNFELAFKQPYVDAPPYIGINLAVNGKAVFMSNLSSRRQPSANRIEKLARPREKHKLKSHEYGTAKPENAENNASKFDEDTGKDEIDTENQSKEKDTSATLKLKETNLTLNYNEKTGIPESTSGKIRNALSNPYSNELARRWISVRVLDSETKAETGKSTKLHRLSMDPSNIRPSGKKTFENTFFRAKNQVKTAKKLKTSREKHENDSASHENKNNNHVENSGHVNKNESHMNNNGDHTGNIRSALAKMISFPEVGTPRTILRYTDKRYGHTKSIAIDMGPETKLRKNTEVVIN